MGRDCLYHIKVSDQITVPVMQINC